MENEKDKDGKFFAGFLLGGILGALLIFILGTKRGKKLAEKLVEKAKDYEDDIDEKLEVVKEKGEDLLKEARKAKKGVFKDINKKQKNISGLIADKTDSVLTKIEDVQKKGIKLTRDVHGRFFSKNGKKLTK